MKASQLVNRLQELIKEHGDLDLVYARDEEGNGYEEIHFDASAGGMQDDEFVPADELEEGEKPDCICVN